MMKRKVFLLGIKSDPSGVCVEYRRLGAPDETDVRYCWGVDELTALRRFNDEFDIVTGDEDGLVSETEAGRDQGS